MRILITNTGSWGTGSFVTIEALAEQLLKLGHSVKIFLPDSGVDSPDKSYYYNNELYKIWKFPITKDNITLPTFPLMIPDPHPRNPEPCIYKFLSEKQLNLYFSEFANEIKKTIGDFKPDIIECQHIWSMDYVVDKIGFPYVSVAHHSDQMGFRFDPRMREIAKQTANNAKYIFAISEKVREEVIELYEVAAEKVIAIDNGYDQTVFYPQNLVRNQVTSMLGVDIPEKAHIVTFAGKLSKTKGIDIILQACRLLNKENIYFLIFGTGKLDEELNAKLPEQKYKKVFLLGHQPAKVIAAAHNIAKVSIAPSREEGFGLACMEAMGCGLPIIVTENTGPTSYAVGKIIDQENSRSLAEAIIDIISQPTNKYQELSKTALEVAKHYTWEKSAKKRLLYYKKIIAG